MTTCKECGARIDHLDTFPGPRCFDCYRKEEDTKAPEVKERLSAAEEYARQQYINQ